MTIENIDRIMRNLSMLIMTIAVFVQLQKDDDFLRDPQPEMEPSTTISIEIPELENGLVNINTANLHRLWNIKGISETRARAIIAYREEHGDFASVDDLVNVSGIGEKTLEQIRRYLTV